MSPRRNWDSPNPPLASVCATPPEPGRGAHSPAGEGLGESQFRRLEKKLSTLPNLMVCIQNWQKQSKAKRANELCWIIVLNSNVYLDRPWRGSEEELRRSGRSILQPHTLLNNRICICIVLCKNMYMYCTVQYIYARVEAIKQFSVGLSGLSAGKSSVRTRTSPGCAMNMSALLWLKTLGCYFKQLLFLWLHCK